MSMRIRLTCVFCGIAALIMLVVPIVVAAAEQEKEFEDFNAKNFDRPTTIDNPWFPLKPGTQWVWEGKSMDDEGDEEARRVVFTVTDLTKEIGGVQTVVCWDQDFADGEPAESEIIFFAQDNDGTVWHLGHYPEEYADGELVATPCWIHGISDGKAGIMMLAKPEMGANYSEGWAPSVNWTDRGAVYQTDQTTTVPTGKYESVLVIDEWNKAEPGAHQLKYYARGVGLVRVGWRADVTDQETLELISVKQLNADELAMAREEALKLEKRARENSKDVFARTAPARPATAEQREKKKAALDTKKKSLRVMNVSAALQASAKDERPRPEFEGVAGQGFEPNAQEFGLTPRQLVQVIEQVEALIAKCMREQGFEYVAADYKTVRKGMSADKSLPGIPEEEFISKYGFGVSTMYTGKAPQLAEGYSPAKVGLGERNVQIYKNLSPADQVAYNRALFGENTDATFAVGMEIEDVSRCGGCTRKAIEQVFKPEQTKATYYNPKDAFINRDPRMKAALRVYSAQMREAGFDYNHPDEVEADIRERLNAITGGGTISVEQMNPDQLAALKKLQDYERQVAVKNFELQEDIFDPVEERIEKELFAAEVK